MEPLTRRKLDENLAEVKQALRDCEFEVVVEVLKQKLHALEFDSALEIVTTFQNTWSLTDDINESTRLAFWAIAAEVFDYRGDYDGAKKIIASEGKSCEAILFELQHRGAGVPQTWEESELLKQRVWTVIHLGMTSFRARAFREAAKRFETCAWVASRFLEQNCSCLGTLARIYYCLGLVHREQYAYSKAKMNFTRSLGYYWRRLREHPNEMNGLNDLMIAKCLGPGLGWVHYTQGNIKQSIPLFLAAKALLLRYPNEELIKTYVDVLYASVLRSTAGGNQKTEAVWESGDGDPLQSAIELLERSHTIFLQKCHPYYSVRTASQLSLAYFAQFQTVRGADEKKELLQRMEPFLQEIERSSDPRFICASSVIRSRICRCLADFKGALDIATKALDNGYERTFSRIEALIACGEARTCLNDFSGAIDNFKLALKEGSENPKIRAVCNLHLAHAYAKNDDLRNADAHFRRAKRIGQHVAGNVFIQELRQEVEDSIKRGDFLIRASADELDPRELQSALHGFLVEWAERRTRTDDEAARTLGISKQTLYNWKSAARSYQRSN